MKGDFSRLTFDPKNHYSAVLMQQGRVQLDADWNEQRAIDRHRTETGARDLVGTSGGPAEGAGFEVGIANQGITLSIGAGAYYVDGILCENEGTVLFESQPDLQGLAAIEALRPPDSDTVSVGLVYLDVWERHITALDDGNIREVALDEADTTTRSRTVWQVKVQRLNVPTTNALQALIEGRAGVDPSNANELAWANVQIVEALGLNCDTSFRDEINQANPPSTGRLRARATPPATSDSPCVVAPGAGYEGLENQLYRVEIHKPGDLSKATFKWSRDNGSVVTAVLKIEPEGAHTNLTVHDLGRDESLGFSVGQYVELTNQDLERTGQLGTFLQISGLDSVKRIITVDATLSEVPDARAFQYMLRRWDSPGEIESPQDEATYVDLENGVQVAFSNGMYNTGDYWLIPARTVMGDIEWPLDGSQEPTAQPPLGIEHHYAPLALVLAANPNGSEQLLLLADCRNLFPAVTNLTSLFYLGGDGQETGSGQQLPRPLVVGVANGDRPVAGACVLFEVVPGGSESYDGRLSQVEGNVQVGTVAEDGLSLETITDASGEAKCAWTLATNQSSQQVKATLLDGTHLPVYFNANLSAEADVVARSIQIKEVILGGGTALRLDAAVPVNALADGIQVVCSDEIDRQSVEGKPTCFVTLELPFPQNAADRELWGDAIIGFQPLVLAAEVGAEETMIVWKPSEATFAWLRDRLFQVLKGTDQVLAHLTLKGNFIWSVTDESPAYLDGEAFVEPSSLDLHYPSGDGRRGGDFEMWFRLVPQQVVLDSVDIEPVRITGGTDNG